eukprot:TRINITY_DN1570_c0_g1_i3.p1 TRINITY_DN1570_c0_g1~~TRINITY_DN1570_c0_g1_i3.p1  ORF type:complete len:309 (-),score=51.96 TRINITY_DN1570_c0_g1_i3:470-1396(-)
MLGISQAQWFQLLLALQPFLHVPACSRGMHKIRITSLLKAIEVKYLTSPVAEKPATIYGRVPKVPAAHRAVHEKFASFLRRHYADAPVTHPRLLDEYSAQLVLEGDTKKLSEWLANPEVLAAMLVPLRRSRFYSLFSETGQDTAVSLVEAISSITDISLLAKAAALTYEIEPMLLRQVMDRVSKLEPRTPDEVYPMVSLLCTCAQYNSTVLDHRIRFSNAGYFRSSGDEADVSLALYKKALQLLDGIPIGQRADDHKLKESLVLDNLALLCSWVFPRQTTTSFLFPHLARIRGMALPRCCTTELSFPK